MKKLAFLCVFILIAGILYAQTADDYLVAGDNHYQKYENELALENYLNALEADSTNYEALWKVSRAYVDIGEAAEEDEQKGNYLKAEKYARQAVEAYPDSAEGHFQLAVAVGRVGLYEGGKTKIELSKEVKEEADKCIALNPNHDGAYHILGRWNREIANLSWLMKAAAKVVYGGVPKGASNENAVMNFQKAIELKPNKLVHHLELAKTYMEMDKWEDAKSELKTVINLPKSDADDPKHKKEAKTLYEEIKDK